MDSAISVEISRLYVSFFNRAADPEGLEYWVGRYNEAVAQGRDPKAFLEDIADSFAQSPEAKAIYETTANPTDAQIEAYIAEAYQNMFGRTPDDEGLAYWAGRWKAEMADGKPGVRVLFEIENAARGSSNAQDIAALQNKAEVAAKFTTDFIASGAEWTEADFATAGTIVKAVDHTPESVTQANEQIADFIQDKTDPDGGQEPNQPGTGNPPAPTLTISVDDDGVVSFGGTAAGKIQIVSVNESDDGQISLVASRGGATQSVTLDNFSGVFAAAGQTLIASAGHIGLLGKIDLNAAANLEIDVSYEKLSAQNPSMPSYDISNIYVSGTNTPSMIWSNISTLDADIFTKFKLFWAAGDAKYYGGWPVQDAAVNLANVDLSNVYVEYLLSGGSAITDIVQTKVDGVPNFDARQQSLHDNLLSNLIESVAIGRFAGENKAWDEGEDPRSSNALQFNDRPYYDGIFKQNSGSEARADQTKVWDILNNVSRPDLYSDVVDLSDGVLTDGLHWVSDRASLLSITRGFDPENEENAVISFNINDKGAASGFDRYQGAWISTDEDKSLPVDGFNIAQDVSASYRFYIDPDWKEDDVSQLSGVWFTFNKAEDATPGTRLWINAEYIDNYDLEAIPHQGPGAAEEGFTGFRFWTSNSGWDKYVAYDGDGWVNFDYRQENGDHNLYLDGTLIYTATSGLISEDAVLESLIFNSQNFGRAQSYLYDDIKLSGISINPDFI